MAGFLYYRPGQRPPTADELASLPFAHAGLAGLPGADCPGPDDKKGWVFTLKPPPAACGVEPRIGYHKEKQQWYPCFDGKLWIGWETERRPGPADLQRREIVAGMTVELTDGHTWTIPQIRDMNGHPAVESVVGINCDGTWNFDQPAPRYAHLWKMIHHLREMIRQMHLRMGMGNPAPLDVKVMGETMIECLVGALALNYRVDRWELGLLNVVTNETIPKLFDAVAGLQTSDLGGD